MEVKTREAYTAGSSSRSRDEKQLVRFKFTDENLKQIEAHIAKYPKGRQLSAMLPVLDIAQRQNGGWLSQDILEEVAVLLGTVPIRVHEVASFYSMFNLAPVGKYHIQVCGTTPCWLRGAAELKSFCQKKLSVSDGEVSSDGLFTVSEVECLGACVNAPIVQINDDYFEDLTVDSLGKIIDGLTKGKRIGEDIKSGTQIDRQFAAPVGYDPDQDMCVPKPKRKTKAKAASEADLKSEKKVRSTSKKKVTDAE